MIATPLILASALSVSKSLIVLGVTRLYLRSSRRVRLSSPAALMPNHDLHSGRSTTCVPSAFSLVEALADAVE